MNGVKVRDSSERLSLAGIRPVVLALLCLSIVPLVEYF